MNLMTSPPAARPYQVLNPRTIGRPLHLMDRFTALLREDLTDRFCAPLNRRYRAGFEIVGVSLDHSTAPPDGLQRRVNYQSDAGRIFFGPDRSILLCILGYRFGTHEGPAEPGEPESGSEQRLTQMLGAQLVSIVSGRIGAQQPQPPEAPAAVPLRDPWTLRVDVAERERQVEGALWFVLEGACIERLLASLSASRTRTAARNPPAPIQPLPARLPFSLTARLLDTEIPLGLLLDTRIGDVIPISLGAADVLIGSSRLFTASVAEHRGKLCLTSFEDVE
jgi:flagellar motor switch protein FliM